MFLSTYVSPSCTELVYLGILIMVQQVRMMMFSLNMVDNSMSFLSLFTLIFYGQVGGTILSKFYSLGFVVGPLLHT